MKTAPSPSDAGRPVCIRLADGEDASGIRAVYEQYVPTPVTFEDRVPSHDEFSARMVDIRATYPCLVAARAREIIGYAYAHRQAERAAYGWNVELSVYLAPGATGAGLGRTLYEALLDLVRAQGAMAAYALVTVPNAASERLHAALGFERIGLQTNAGWKAGAWRDVAWLRKELSSFDGEPQPLVPFPVFARERPDAVQNALDRANDALRRRAAEG